MLRRHTFAIPLLVLALLAGCSRKDDTGEDTSPVAAGVDFLMFPNPQASLGAADYDVVIENNTASTLSYTLTVIQTDSTSQAFTGSVPASPASGTVTYGQNHAGGVTISLNSGGAAATLRLCVHLTTCTAASANIATAAGANPSITLPLYQIDQAAYTNAYYTVVDSLSAKTTLAAFKTANNFNATNCQPGITGTAEEYEVKFRDVHDLGYGRHMCVHRNITTGDIAVWVENFQVSAISSQHYGPLNLEALINNDYRWHVGTNAIEYSATPTSGGVKFVKFYTFNPDGTRRTLVDLDGRGAKAMPIPCITCHGGKGLPLTAAGLFPTIAAFPRAETLAHMQALNVDTLDFSDKSPWTRPEQEATLKRINQIVLCTYPLPFGTSSALPEDACRSASTAIAGWQGTTAEMVKSWYGGNGMPNPAAQDAYVPTGWTDGATAPVSGDTVPAGATNLYRTVVAPYCRVCHALRGNLNSPGANDIDFTEYSKFIGTSTYQGFAVGPAGGGHYNRILYHAFEKGHMPLALLKWEQFWDSAAPMTLAGFVPGAMSGGSVLRPNRPVAIPGPDRIAPINAVFKLSGATSINATSYRWRVTSGLGIISAGELTSIRPTFTAPGTNGAITTVELVVSDGVSNSDPVTMTITASSAVTVLNPSAIRFADIKNILQNTGGITPATPCTGCHTNAAGNNGPPVFYNTYDRVGSGNANDAANLHQFYLDIRARINFTDVEASFILRRPSGHHHPGGLLNGFDVDNQIGGDRTHYNTILNWIMNGAPE